MTLLQNKQTSFQLIRWIVYGCILGTAAIIPGLSMGTLAVILGIYNKIILTTTRLFPFSLLTKNKLDRTNLVKDKLLILTLSIGMGISIFILSDYISYLIKTHPIAIYSLFTGLIVASLPDIFKEIKSPLARLGSLFVIALVLGITLLTKDFSIPISHALWHYLVSGFLACFFAAMPGLSGSMALLLLGTYSDILQAIQNGPADLLVTFTIGGMIGLICALKILQVLLKQNKSWFFALIFGFILGSLPAVFPYREWSADNSESFFITSLCFMSLGIGIFYMIQYLSKRLP